MRFSCFTFLFLLALALMVNAQPLDKITKEGDRYGIELDVVFDFEAKDETVTRWKQIFKGASARLRASTNGNFYIKKVNLFVCPLDSSDEGYKSSADILIHRGTGRARTEGLISNQFKMSLYDDPGRGTVDLQETVGHELCHYLFDLRDEYFDPAEANRPDSNYLAKLTSVYPFRTGSGSDTLQAVKLAFEEGKFGKFVVQSTQDEQALLTRYPGANKYYFRMYCSEPFYENPSSCTMDGLPAPGGSGRFNDYYDKLCSDEDHLAATFTTDNQSQLVVLTKNGQSKIHNMSCRAVAQKAMKDLSIDVDLSIDPSPSTLAPETEFEEKNDCEEVVILLLDKSGSMSGLPILELKQAVIQLIDLLSDEVTLGIIWFDSQPTAAVSFPKLGDANSRFLAKQAVTPISASGGTRIGFGLGVAYEQIRLLREPNKPRREETIYLVTDGVSSDDTTAVVNTIRDDDVKIRTVALGQDVDTFGLFEMAALTGGQSFIARENEDIGKVVIQGTAESLENYFVLSRLEAEDLSNLQFNVDSYVEQLLVQVRLDGVLPDELSKEKIVLTGPNGQNLNFVFRSEGLDADTLSLILELEDPGPGLYSLSFDSSLLGGAPSLEGFVFGLSDALVWEADNRTGKDIVQYPEPVLIEGTIESFLGTAHGLSVEGIVKRPDGSEVLVRLYDDGSLLHGDDIANDGVYTARFLNYNGDGTYEVNVVATNDGSARAGFGQHGSPDEDSPNFEPFSREAGFSIELTGFSNPIPSSLILEPLTPNLEDLEFNRDFTGSAGVPIGGFRAKVGPGQGVKIKSLTLAPSEEELTSFSRFSVYIDGDDDGLVDFVGPFSSPQSSITGKVEDGRIVLDDVVELEGDTESNIIILGEFDAGESIEVGDPLSLEAGVPLMLFAMLTLFVGRRRKLALTIGAALCVLLFLGGCGGGSDNFVITTPASAPATAVVEPVTFQAELDFQAVEAVGRIDGEPVEVQTPSGTSSEGPQIRIE